MDEHKDIERIVAAAIQIVAHSAPIFVGSRLKELEAALIAAGYGRDIAEERRGMR